MSHFLSPSYSIKEAFHYKKDRPVWIVHLAERVEKCEYQRLLSKAQMLGGWYSQYYKDQAGFHFFSEEAALEFTAAIHNNHHSSGK
jgi:hypothetical protein